MKFVLAHVKLCAPQVIKLYKQMLETFNYISYTNNYRRILTEISNEHQTIITYSNTFILCQATTLGQLQQKKC